MQSASGKTSPPDLPISLHIQMVSSFSLICLPNNQFQTFSSFRAGMQLSQVLTPSQRKGRFLSSQRRRQVEFWSISNVAHPLFPGKTSVQFNSAARGGGGEGGKQKSRPDRGGRHSCGERFLSGRGVLRPSGRPLHRGPDSPHCGQVRSPTFFLDGTGHETKDIRSSQSIGGTHGDQPHGNQSESTVNLCTN